MSQFYIGPIGADPNSGEFKPLTSIGELGFQPSKTEPAPRIPTVGTRTFTATFTRRQGRGLWRALGLFLPLTDAERSAMRTAYHRRRRNR